MTYHHVRNYISFSWLRSCQRWPISCTSSVAMSLKFDLWTLQVYDLRCLLLLVYTILINEDLFWFQFRLGYLALNQGTLYCGNSLLDTPTLTVSLNLFQNVWVWSFKVQEVRGIRKDQVVVWCSVRNTPADEIFQKDPFMTRTLSIVYEHPPPLFLVMLYVFLISLFQLTP